MDANQQRFWQLADAADWDLLAQPAVPRAVEYDSACRRLRLRDRSAAPAMRGTVDIARRDAWRSAPALVRDAFGTVAFVAAGGVFTALEAPGESSQTSTPPPPPVPLLPVPAGDTVTDLALGYDDVLYVAFRRVAANGDILRAWIGLLDRRGRWSQPAVREVALVDFAPLRMVADPAGGVWVLGHRVTAGVLQELQIARLSGLPLRDGQPGNFHARTFRPDQENLAEPRLQLAARQPVLEPGEEGVSMACCPAGQVALLTWFNSASQLHLRSTGGRWSPRRELLDASTAVGIAWISASRLAVIPPPRQDNGQLVLPREALAYDPDDVVGSLTPVGGFLPLRDLTAASLGQWVQSPGLPPHYRISGPTLPAASPVMRPLLPLSVASFERTGGVESRLIDGELDLSTWHRVYLEGVFPPECGAVVDLAASDTPQFLPQPTDWHRHEFGRVPEGGADSVDDLPARGVWVPDRSEIPAHSGLLGQSPVRNRAGLWTALIQRPGLQVRALRGRYLRVRITLFGAGHTTPEIAAIRLHGSRYSYRDHYLPELYRETLFGEESSQRGRATGPDFLDRFLGLFESVLTPLEDRVAAAHLWMHPDTVPADALEWLGAWMGVVYEPAFGEARRRAWLAAAHRLFQTRGTLAGLQLALEIATGGECLRTVVEDLEAAHLRAFSLSRGEAALEQFGTRQEILEAQGGGVTGGEILVVEDFRLRRVFATLLGANLSVQDDPLLPGLIISGNSHVGDTLILGDEEKKEFLALFREGFSNDPAVRSQEEQAVFALFDRLAYRVTILVHASVEATDFGLIQRIAEREAPAHVQVRVVRASEALMVGVASLVEVDTYLGPKRPRQLARVGRSRLGEDGFVSAVPSLDPRYAGRRIG